MTDHIRNRTAYDTTLLPGAWRPTFDPRRKCYVLRWCQAISLAHPIPSPNEALGTDKVDWRAEDRRDTSAAFAAARIAIRQRIEARYDAIVQALRESDKPLCIAELVELLGGKYDWYKQHMMQIPGVYVAKRGQNNVKFYSVEE